MLPYIIALCRKADSLRLFCAGFFSCAVRPLAIAVAVLSAGCHTSKEYQLTRVAKDWCLTIRASQVIPVYPLTEDVQPGDIYLVQVPVDQQQRIYDERGFLPLDNHIARLNPLGYAGFYSHSFLAGSAAPLLPRDWIRPTNGTAQAWEPAPHAAFPTYSFSVRRGAGLSLAVPVQGVPVGLSLLGSTAAAGEVAIKKARTLGVDSISLYRQVQEWAATNADFLRPFAGGEAAGKTNFLRVVSRIYATAEMEVSLRDASSQSAGADVGVPKPVNLLFPELPSGQTNTAETVARNYTNGWATLQGILAMVAQAAGSNSLLPGGSLRLAAASSRSITLQEPFDPPVVIGYLAFDCAIYPGGILGPPVPTHAVLDKKINLGRLLAISPTYGQILNVTLYNILRDNPSDARAREIVRRLDALEAAVPNEFTQYSTTQATAANYVLTAATLGTAELHPANLRGYRCYHQFNSTLERSVTALENALQQKKRLRLKKGQEDPGPVPPGSPLRADLEQTLEYYRNLLNRNTEDPNIQNAIADAHGYYLETFYK